MRRHDVLRHQIVADNVCTHTLVHQHHIFLHPVADRACVNLPPGTTLSWRHLHPHDSETEMETDSAVNRTDLLWLLVVGAVWGITNPFLKRRSTLSAHPEGQNLEADKEKMAKDSGSQSPNWKSNPFGCFCSFWRQLLTDWQVQFTSFGHAAIKIRAKSCAKPLDLSLHVCSSNERNTQHYSYD